MKNFWATLQKPFLVLAPMDDVTDTVFRQVVLKAAGPDVYITEFVNVEGLNSPGRDALMPRLKFDKKEKPLVAQIWGTELENFFLAAKLIKSLGFDGIDINMGCPDKKVMKVGAGAALINNPALAGKIIQATKKGAGGLPVSVKTRIGIREIVTVDWITFLLNQDLAALTVHGRTAKEMSKVPAHWEEIGKVVKIKNDLGLKTLIIGNGDVENKRSGMEYADKYGVDGVMIGRGIFHDIFAFTDNPLSWRVARGDLIGSNNREILSVEDFLQNDDAGIFQKDERLSLLLYHVNLFEKTWGNTKNYDILKKFYKIYINGFPGASKLRDKFMKTKSYQEAKNLGGIE